MPVPPLAGKLWWPNARQRDANPETKPEFVFASKFAERARLARHSLSQALVASSRSSTIAVTTPRRWRASRPIGRHRMILGARSRPDWHASGFRATIGLPCWPIPTATSTKFTTNTSGCREARRARNLGATLAQGDRGAAADRWQGAAAAEVKARCQRSRLHTPDDRQLRQHSLSRRTLRGSLAKNGKLRIKVGSHPHDRICSTSACT